MVYFIGDVTSGSLQKLRQQIFRNTEELLRLFDERRKLSKSISIIKSQANIDIRDREREIFVMNNIHPADSIQKGILNMIFEYTISCETMLNVPEESSHNSEPIVIRGPISTLELLASTISCSPGTEVYANNELNEKFIIGAVKKGAHIIVGNCNNADIKIGHCEELGTYDIVISNNDTMKVRSEIVHSGGIGLKVQVD